MPVVCYQWGSRSPETARMFEPRPVGWEGGTLGLWQYNRRLEAAAVAAALVSRQWSPSPIASENNSKKAIRRIFNQLVYRFPCLEVVVGLVDGVQLGLLFRNILKGNISTHRTITIRRPFCFGDKKKTRILRET